MKSDGSPKPAYYYASGARVALAPCDDLVAIHESRVDAHRVSASDLGALRQAGQALRGGVFLVPAASLSAPLRGTLDEMQAVQRVFRSEGAILVPLPEVRVEDGSPERMDRARAWLRERPHSAEVSSDRPEMLVVRMGSGRGDEALTLANDLTEATGVSTAQARFIRVVDRFGPP